MVKLQGQMVQLTLAVEGLREEWEEAAEGLRAEREAARCVVVDLSGNITGAGRGVLVGRRWRQGDAVGSGPQASDSNLKQCDGI
jgi:hypothetical protein